MLSDLGDGAIACIATDAAVETTLPLAHLDDIPAVAALMRQYALPISEILAARAGES